MLADWRGLLDISTCRKIYNEMHKPRAPFSSEVFFRKYVFIYYDIFYVHSFSIKFVNSLKNANF